MLEVSARLPERVVLVHQYRNATDERECPEEFKALALSAGASICACVTGFRPSPDPATFIGRGKLEELKTVVAAEQAELVIVNHSITPVQERNLSRALCCRVLDRTGLILDIFAQRAASAEGKLQVELAQLRHLSTRLVRGWTHLERQKGGIGLRGPGETQLETDRRLIAQRIRHLNKRLQRVAAQRDLRRKARRKVPIPTVCLVGYTNAGKSSLFNTLTGAKVLAEDRLFATLDPTMRRVQLPEKGEIVLSDTVGFIRDLPHSLIKAFHSTLEEVNQAALLLHVVDINDPQRYDHIQQVEQVLAEIDADEVPRLMVFNKIDGRDIKPHVERDRHGRVAKVWLSARSGEGADLLLDAMSEYLLELEHAYDVRVPLSLPRARAFLHEHATVREEFIDADAWLLRVDIGEMALGRLRQQGDFPRLSLHPVVDGEAVGAN